MHKKLTTKEILIECAITLFKEYGYDNITIKRICEEANITKTTFYYHYKSKEELISDYFSPMNVISNERIVSILSAEEYANELWLLCEMNTKHLIRAGVNMTKELYRNSLKTYIIPLSPENIYLRDIILVLLKRAQECGQIGNPAPIEELYDALIYMLNGANYIWAMSDGNFDIIAECKRIFCTLLMVKLDA